MPDDPEKRGGQDRKRINVNQDHELRNWSQTLGVTPEQLKEAVQAVGDQADKVEEHLQGSRGGRAGGKISERK